MFDFGCFAPDCTARGLINPAGNTTFWKTLWKCTSQGLGANVLGPLWPQVPNLSIINSILWNLFSFPFLENSHCSFLEGFLLLLESRQRNLFTDQSGFPSISQADEEEGFAITNCELCPGSASQHKPQPTVAEPLHICVTLVAVRSCFFSIYWWAGEYLCFLWHFFPPVATVTVLSGC